MIDNSFKFVHKSICSVKAVEQLVAEMEELPETAFHDYRVEYTVYSDLPLTQVI